MKEGICDIAKELNRKYQSKEIDLNDTDLGKYEKHRYQRSLDQNIIYFGLNLNIQAGVLKLS